MATAQKKKPIWCIAITLRQAQRAAKLPERDSNCSSNGSNRNCRHDMRGCWWDENGKTMTGQECIKCGYCLTYVEPAKGGDGESV